MLFGGNMIITISGTPGSGKSTVAKAIAKDLGFQHFSAGDFMRAMALERKISLARLLQEAKKSDQIDKEVDKRTVDLAKKEDNFVIDSRLAFHFIPKAVKLFLKCDLKEAARRAMGDVLAGKRSEEFAKSQEEMEKKLHQRIESEVSRYEKYYGVDYLDEENYDFVLDTTSKSVPQVVSVVLNFVRSKK